MRNLSYREASVALALIGAACAACHQLWFAPALAQIERDRRTLEGLVATLAKPAAKSAPGARPARAAQPAAPEVTPPLSARPSRPTRHIVHDLLPARRPAAPARCDALDPLCGDLEL
jgi:hypothetical protein